MTICKLTAYYNKLICIRMRKYFVKMKIIVLNTSSNNDTKLRMTGSWLLLLLDKLHSSMGWLTVIVSVVSGGENGGHEGRTSHGRIFT